MSESKSTAPPTHWLLVVWAIVFFGIYIAAKVHTWTTVGTMQYFASGIGRSGSRVAYGLRSVRVSTGCGEGAGNGDRGAHNGPPRSRAAAPANHTLKPTSAAWRDGRRSRVSAGVRQTI
jgi:hypothetical protein